MLDWFFDLTPLYRILVLATVLAFLIFAAPSVKLTFRNLVKAFFVLAAALLIYFFWTGENPRQAFQRISHPAATEQPVHSIPKYYDDPEKNWENNK